MKKTCYLQLMGKPKKYSASDSMPLLYNLALKREKRLRQAIEWALGVHGDFKMRQKNDGPFWWRDELQKRAGLEWDGEKFIDVQH